MKCTKGTIETLGNTGNPHLSTTQSMKSFQQLLTDQLPNFKFKAELARKLDISPQVLQTYLKGKCQPNYDEAIRMLKELGISTLNYREI